MLPLALHSLIYPVSVATILQMDLEVIDTPPRTRLIIFTRAIITSYPWHRNIVRIRTTSPEAVERIQWIS